MKKDVIVIGGGCAGMVAALEAEREGAEVILVDRGPIGIGTNSALAGGIFAGATPRYSPEQHIKDTLETGRGINRQRLLQLAAEQASEAFSFLRSSGVEFTESRRGYRVKSSRPGLIPGVTLVKILAEKIRPLGRVQIVSGLYITEILRDKEKAYGVTGFDGSGEILRLFAPAIILATGGAGALYRRNDNQKGIMGQGYHLAAKAGLELWDMEFVQSVPLVIAEPSLASLTVRSPRPPQAKLINAKGEDLLKKYDIGDIDEATVTRRDEFSAILYREGLQGPVYMDYREVPGSLWKKHPLNILEKMHYDFRRKPFQVSPAVHFFMGGVWTDEGGQTSLPGLFACGEVAWGFHGANRMAGNALTECVVFGRITARNAVRYALAHRLPSSFPKGTSEDISRGVSPVRGQLKELRQQLRETAWRHAGLVRSKKQLNKGLGTLAELENELNRVMPQTVSDRRLKEELTSAAFVLRAVLTASLPRNETRGAFILDDISERDDRNWRKNSCLTYDSEQDVFMCSHYPPNAPR